MTVARRYTKEEVDYLISIVPGHSYREIIKQFYDRFGTELTFNQVKNFIGNRKLNTGRTGQFQKGHVPFNKGKKGLTTGGVETQFKKGHRPANYLPIGTERVRTPRKNRKTIGDYIDVKIADPNKWRGKHLLVWEAHHGRSVPKGYCVIFGDGNNRNFDPDNLILVSRKQLAILNKRRLIQNDADLTRTAIIIADLSTKIRELERRKQANKELYQEQTEEMYRLKTQGMNNKEIGEIFGIDPSSTRLRRYERQNFLSSKGGKP